MSVIALAAFAQAGNLGYATSYSSLSAPAHGYGAAPIAAHGYAAAPIAAHGYAAPIAAHGYAAAPVYAKAAHHVDYFVSYETKIVTNK